MLHTKGRTTIEELRKVKLKKPEGVGNYWRGIAHASLVEGLFREATTLRWTLKNAVYYLSKDKADMAASFDLDNVPISIGLINSNSRSQTLKLYVGVRHGVGIMVPDCYEIGKHTELLINDSKVGAGLKRIRDITPALCVLPKELTWNLPKPKVEEVLFTAGLAGVMPWSRVGRIAKQLQEGGSALEVLIAFSVVVRRNPPLKQFSQLHRFWQIVESSLH